MIRRTRLAAFALLLLIGFSFALTSVTGCMELTSADTYRLANNLSWANISASPLTGNACVKISASNVILDCNGFNITNNGTAVDTYGILLYNVNNATVKNCPGISGYSRGFYISYGSNHTFTNNSARNNTQYGFHLEDSSNNTLINNSVWNNSLRGFYISSSFNNTIFNNTAINSTYGFYISGSYSKNNTIFNNTAYNNTASGFYLDSSSNNNALINNSAWNNTQYGFALSANSINNTIINNSAYNNIQYGFYLSVNSNNNVLINNFAHNNSQHGIYVTTHNNTLINNSAWNNRQAGIYLLSSSNNTLNDTILYNNSIDFMAWTSISFNMSRTLFLNPSGTLENYTNLSINDSTTTDSYTINWSDNTTALPLPANLTSFAQKYVNINTAGGTAYIDQIVWHWTDGELAGSDDESTFALWKHNGTWTVLNNTPDTSGNTLSLSNHNPASIYGILQNTFSFSPYFGPGTALDCTAKQVNITTPAYYFWNQSGATSTNYAGPHPICMNISVSDVVIDCSAAGGVRGTIYGPASGTAVFYIADGVENVTIINCRLENYTAMPLILAPNATAIWIGNNTLVNFTNISINGTGNGDISFVGNLVDSGDNTSISLGAEDLDNGANINFSGNEILSGNRLRISVSAEAANNGSNAFFMNNDITGGDNSIIDLDLESGNGSNVYFEDNNETITFGENSSIEIIALTNGNGANLTFRNNAFEGGSLDMDTFIDVGRDGGNIAFRNSYFDLSGPGTMDLVSRVTGKGANFDFLNSNLESGNVSSISIDNSNVGSGGNSTFQNASISGNQGGLSIISTVAGNGANMAFRNSSLAFEGPLGIQLDLTSGGNGSNVYFEDNDETITFGENSSIEIVAQTNGNGANLTFLNNRFEGGSLEMQTQVDVIRDGGNIAFHNTHFNLTNRSNMAFAAGTIGGMGWNFGFINSSLHAGNSTQIAIDSGYSGAGQGANATFQNALIDAYSGAISIREKASGNGSNVAFRNTSLEFGGPLRMDMQLESGNGSNVEFIDNNETITFGEDSRMNILAITGGYGANLTFLNNRFEGGPVGISAEVAAGNNGANTLFRDTNLLNGSGTIDLRSQAGSEGGNFEFIDSSFSFLERNYTQILWEGVVVDGTCLFIISPEENYTCMWDVTIHDGTCTCSRNMTIAGHIGADLMAASGANATFQNSSVSGRSGSITLREQASGDGANALLHGMRLDFSGAFSLEATANAGNDGGIFSFVGNNLTSGNASQSIQVLASAGGSGGKAEFADSMIMFGGQASIYVEALESAFLENEIYNSDRGMRITGYRGVNLTSNYLFNGGAISLNSPDAAAALLNNTVQNSTYVELQSSYANATANHICGNSRNGLNVYSVDAALSHNVFCNNQGYGLEVSSDSVTSDNDSIYGNIDHIYVYPGSGFHATGLHLGSDPFYGIRYAVVDAGPAEPVDANRGNILLNVTFISMNHTDPLLADLDAPANITVAPIDCSNIAYYNDTADVFPQTAGQIIANGDIFTPVYSNCTEGVATFQVSGFSGYTTSPAPPAGEETPEEKDELSLTFASGCSSNLVIVKSHGNPVSGATVKVSGDSIGTTNSSGQVSFDGCGMSDIIIHASKSGYGSDYMTADTISCEECTGECVHDADCPEHYLCDDDECVPRECDPECAEDYACVDGQCTCGYGCCADGDCEEGETCDDHACRLKYECTSDDDCASTEYCDISTGAAGGTCEDVVGECGYAFNHAFVPYGYECGPEPGCPSCPGGTMCINHVCSGENLTCPESGIVGDSKNCTATCASCPYQITDPAGRKYGGMTGADGNFVLPLNVKGNYTVALVDANGTTLKHIVVEAFPRAAPTEDKLPSLFGPEDAPLCGLLILLVIIILLIIYWRGRKKKEKPAVVPPKKTSSAKPR